MSTPIHSPPARPTSEPASPRTPGHSGHSDSPETPEPTVPPTPSVTVRDAHGRPVYVSRADSEIPQDVLTQGTSVTIVGVQGLHPTVGPRGGILLRSLPANARRHKRFQSIVSFRPRRSHFDRFNAESSTDSFRGFYTLFWICMSIAVLNSFWRSYHRTGSILSLTFFNLFSRDAKMLALSDLVLVSHLFLAVPLMQVAQRYRLSYSHGLIVLVHVWLGLMLAAVIQWSRYREWPWVQSGFFVLHAMAMGMKLYSYLEVNGHHLDDYKQLHRKEDQLLRRVQDVEGPNFVDEGTSAQADANAHPSADASIHSAAHSDKSSPSTSSEHIDRAAHVWRRACSRALHHSEVLDPDFVERVVRSDWCKEEVQRGTNLVRYEAKNLIVWRIPTKDVQPPNLRPEPQDIGKQHAAQVESVAKETVDQALAAAGISTHEEDEKTTLTSADQSDASPDSGSALGSRPEPKPRSASASASAPAPAPASPSASPSTSTPKVEHEPEFEAEAEDEAEAEAKPAPEPEPEPESKPEKPAGTATAQARSRRQAASRTGRKEELLYIRDPHPLATHPDVSISQLASEIEILRDNLVSQDPYRRLDAHQGAHRRYSGYADSEFRPPAPTLGAGEDLTLRYAYPFNLTYGRFWDYLMVPSLVYELEYPRTESVRPGYLLEKVLATFGTFFCIYIITTSWILPITPSREDSWTDKVGTFLQLAIPMMGCYILIFYIIFESILNFFAEATRFADREFYRDWWNSKSMDEFSRNWNRPVHSFLLKHVYASTISVGASKSFAIFFTFLLSSLMHELVMAIVTGKLRGYLFMLQMAQLPLIVLGQTKFIKDSPARGNLIFWIGLMVGFPLLNILYLSY